MIKKQMEMFDEGGLEQDGGSVDPVSGNEVPIGSSKEEVRDDIDAKLSEGEFVFPADVVRFIGLNNLMQIRQEAKAGLKKMEAMGQMGNSEEATMPDDIPFSSEDIMVEDDDGNEGDLEMNVGGFVPTQGVYYQPSQVGSQFNIAPQIPAYKPPQPFQPPMQQQQQQTGYGPSFMGQPQTQQQVKPDPLAQEWFDKNSWFGKDEIATAVAVAVDQKLKNEGYDPNTKEFYNEIDRLVQQELPHKFNREMDNTTKPSQVVAGTSRKSSPKNKVRLSKKDVELAKKWGIPLDRYAAEKKKVDNLSGNYTTIETKRA